MKHKFKAASSWMLTAAIILSSFSTIPADVPVTENVSEKTISETGAAGSDRARMKRRMIRVSTPDELIDLAGKCVLDKSSANIRVLLENDIDLTGIEFDGFNCFSGIFEGQGHTIKGYFIKGDHSNMGFFRYLTETAIIRNLNVEGSLSCSDSGTCIGGLAGRNSGLISNCSFNGSVSAQENTGGLVGYNEPEGLIVNSAFYGKALGPHMTGGIAGLNEGNIFSCANAGSVNTEPVSVSDTLSPDLSSVLLGGGIGSLDPGTIDISSIGNEDFVDIINIGGIAGQSVGVIDNCVNEGTVGYPHTGYNVGGIAGYTGGLISSCRNDAAVYGRKDTGGIAGQLEPETIWEYSSDQLDELLRELEDLNALLAGMISDVSTGIGNTHDHVTAVETALGQTISDLRSLIGETVGDLYVQGDLIRNMMELLAQSISTEDLQGINDSLNGLYNTLKETDFFANPIQIGLDGTVNADVNGDLNTKTTISNELIFSIYQDLVLLIAGTRSNADPGTTVTVPSDPEETIPTVNDSAASDDDAYYYSEDDDNSYEYQEDDASGDGSYDYDEYAASDDSSYDYDEGDASGDGSYEYEEGDASDDSSYEYQEDDDADALSADPDSESSDDGTDDTMTDVPAEPAEEGTAPKDETPSSGDDSSRSSSKSLRVMEDLDESVSVLLQNGLGINVDGTAGGNIDGDLNVKLDMDDLPTADELTGLIEDLLSHCGNLLDTDTLALAAGVLQEIGMPNPDTSAFNASFNSLLEAMKPLDDDIAQIASTGSEDFSAVTEQMNTICNTFFDYIENLSALNDRTAEDDSVPDAWSSDTSAVSMCLNCGSVSADTNVGGVVGSVSYEDAFDAEDLLDVSGYILKDSKKIIFASVRRCENRGKINAKKTKAGGIAGSLSNGIITGCSSSGEISVDEGGSYCGGIAGEADSAITESLAKNLVVGSSYAGGITGKGNTILSCITYSEVRSDGTYKGAVAGWAEGEVSNNLYIDRGLGGIDGVSFTGSTDPFTEEEAVTLAAQQQTAAAETTNASSETESETTSETESEPASESETVPASESETVPASASETVPASESEIVPASESEAETASESEAETASESEAETASGAEAETVSEMEAEIESRLLSVNNDNYGVPENTAIGGTYVLPEDDSFDLDYEIPEDRPDTDKQTVPDDLSSGTPDEDKEEEETQAESTAKTAAELAIEKARQEAEEKETETGSFSQPALSSNDPVITFMRDDETVAEVVVPFGQGISELPKVPNDGDDYWVWDDFDQDEVYSSLTVNGSYHHPIRTLASDDNPPTILVEGTFYDGMKLSVSTDDLPTGDEENGKEPLKAYTVGVSNYSEPLKVRTKAEDGGTLYQVGDDYALTELPYEADGSYLVFELPNNGTFAYSPLSEIEKKFPLAAKLGISGCIAAAVILLLVLIHIHRKRKRRKRASA